LIFNLVLFWIKFHMIDFLKFLFSCHIESVEILFTFLSVIPG
jgi:hypothetical protein